MELLYYLILWMLTSLNTKRSFGGTHQWKIFHLKFLYLQSSHDENEKMELILFSIQSLNSLVSIV